MLALTAGDASSELANVDGCVAARWTHRRSQPAKASVGTPESASICIIISETLY